MRFKGSSTAVAAVAAILICGSWWNAHAGTINRVTSFRTPGFSTGSVTAGLTPAPNNDDEPGASPNVIPFSVFFNSPGMLETEFELSDSGGVTEYRFTQTFFNNTEDVWTGFRFELGFGAGVGFLPSQPADGLRFDSFENNSTATSNAFSLVFDNLKVLGWGGGSVPRFRPAVFTFAFDVPDGLAAVNPGGLNRFTLRQTPIVAGAEAPEPATYLLLGSALATLAVLRKKSRTDVDPGTHDSIHK